MTHPRSTHVYLVQDPLNHLPYSELQSVAPSQPYSTMQSGALSPDFWTLLVSMQSQLDLTFFVVSFFSAVYVLINSSSTWICVFLSVLENDKILKNIEWVLLYYESNNSAHNLILR